MAREAGTKQFKDPSGRKVQVRMGRWQQHSNGGFSLVYRTRMAEQNSTGKPIDVAIKQTYIQKSSRCCRELQILRLLAVRFPHQAILKLLYSHRTSYEDDRITYSLVFPLMSTTLDEVYDKLSRDRNIVDIKLYTWQLFAGLDHLKKLRIIHRDIKPSNLLIDPDTGRLCIADFGSAIFHPCARQGNYIFTRPYRPPELLLGALKYDCCADVWSAGCVLAQLYLGEPFIRGDDGGMQLQLIYKLLGTPSLDELNDMGIEETKFTPASHPQVVNNPMNQLSRRFGAKDFKNADNPAAFILRILQFSPKKRLSGRALLLDPFFDVLFQDNKLRKNKKPVSGVLTKDDRQRIEGTPV